VTRVIAESTVRADSFSIPFLSSILIHGCAILVASFLLQGRVPRQQNYFPVRLIEAPELEPEPLKPAAPETKPPSTKSTTEPIRITKPPLKSATVAPSPTLPATKPEEPIKSTEAKTPAPAPSDSLPSDIINKHGEDGGGPAGAIASSGSGNAGVVPGTGTGVGGGGTASLGLGRGGGAPGSPAQPIRANREAKPIQTARAVYPPMALRAGLESDVTLRIQVDPQGNVTRAEIAKSGGSGFDEEALRAVKQSRFEPAQRDGDYVMAEFTYIYRFRLSR
jgi:TonB family protein